MKWENINQQVCSISRSLAVIGDRWTFLIVRDLFIGVHRFSQLQKNSGINKHRLSDRLTRLLDAGIVKKAPYGEHRKRYEYYLTEKGLDLFPILMAMIEWGDRWESDEDGVPLTVHHKACGHRVTTRVKCDHCDQDIDPFSVEIKAGPGSLKKIDRGEKSLLSPAINRKTLN